MTLSVALFLSHEDNAFFCSLVGLFLIRFNQTANKLGSLGLCKLPKKCQSTLKLFFPPHVQCGLIICS